MTRCLSSKALYQSTYLYLLPLQYKHGIFPSLDILQKWITMLLPRSWLLPLWKIGRDHLAIFRLLGWRQSLMISSPTISHWLKQSTNQHGSEPASLEAAAYEWHNALLVVQTEVIMRPSLEEATLSLKPCSLSIHLSVLCRCFFLNSRMFCNIKS